MGFEIIDHAIQYLKDKFYLLIFFLHISVNWQSMELERGKYYAMFLNMKFKKKKIGRK